MPFSRNQRSIVYQRAKRELDKRPFGTQLDVYQVGYEWINHSIAPAPVQHHDFRVQIGRVADEADPGGYVNKRGVSKPYAASVFNISAMSFGALSANAIRALNQGAQLGGFAHGHRRRLDLALSPRIRRRPDLGDRFRATSVAATKTASFSEERFVDNATIDQVRMIEVKLSQGAKPGHGGVLPGAKVSLEIARARGVPQGIDCVLAGATSGVLDADRPARIRRPAAQPVRRQADRLQALHRPPVGVLRHREGDGRDRHHARLHRRRRWRRRHRRGAGRVHRPLSARRCSKGSS